MYPWLSIRKLDTSRRYGGNIMKRRYGKKESDFFLKNDAEGKGGK